MLEAYERLLSASRERGDREGEGRVLNDMGLVLARSKRYDEALRCFASARELFEELAEPLLAAEQWGNIGSVFRDMRRYPEALHSYERALCLFESMGHREGVADQCTNIAYIHATSNRLQEACAWYRRALPLYQEAGSERKARLTRQNLESLERSAG